MASLLALWAASSPRVMPLSLVTLYWTVHCPSGAIYLLNIVYPIPQFCYRWKVWKKKMHCKSKAATFTAWPDDGADKRLESERKKVWQRESKLKLSLAWLFSHHFLFLALEASSSSLQQANLQLQSSHEYNLIAASDLSCIFPCKTLILEQCGCCVIKFRTLLDSNCIEALCISILPIHKLCHHEPPHFGSIFGDPIPPPKSDNSPSFCLLSVMC